MDNYIALFVQEGDGCDHTIGCGLNWQVFDGSTESSILSDVRTYVKEHYNNKDTRLFSCLVYRIDEKIKTNVRDWYKEFEEEDKEKVKTSEEFKLYLKLKEKFKDA